MIPAGNLMTGSTPSSKYMAPAKAAIAKIALATQVAQKLNAFAPRFPTLGQNGALGSFYCFFCFG